MSSRVTAASDQGTAERILDAAELEFAAVGFAPARLADIAARAGIRRPSLLYHFPSKELLYRSVVERVFDLLGTELLRPMSTAGDFEQQVEAIVDSFAGFLQRRPSLAPIIVRELIDEPADGDEAQRCGGGVGHSILLERVVPLLTMVEGFIRTRGQAQLREDLPLRAAIVQIAANVLLHTAAGSLAEPLWGPGDHTRSLARLLLFREESSR